MNSKYYAFLSVMLGLFSPSIQGKLYESNNPDTYMILNIPDSHPLGRTISLLVQGPGKPIASTIKNDSGGNIFINESPDTGKNAIKITSKLYENSKACSPMCTIVYEGKDKKGINSYRVFNNTDRTYIHLTPAFYSTNSFNFEDKHLTDLGSILVEETKS